METIAQGIRLTYREDPGDPRFCFIALRVARPAGMALPPDEHGPEALRAMAQVCDGILSGIRAVEQEN